ncbi:hypothetical protein [Pseudomonas syringae]|uniref:Uncharacterized protein n=3 Tax=Pseudomonas syringae TaxID=317 RepID=A0A656JJT2_PSESF|nr:hypothetical protein [Pseudomonas syringae]EPN31788.1 hypothetical protein A245_44640 [Pseudomonas syringae pv. actinidiae ICMP 19096]EPM49050.1 hypothetical protein A246_08880 [Pseudomonas syringae pv. actinidiae ICMP 19098]EPM64928.1 hypothetical protein A249_42086 [Pseudomonas syringae pv. actinidiae ICMP 18804]EPN19709.1 hypothetical protein A248_08837 [Pseudomonas syringae pv. actinidiae ICMP 19100]EPN27575.1 hypothetical protein A247_08850 [Pseudomonas syringae pv. actinidiae ICMP 190
MINVTFESGDIIATLALLFSVYATFKTVQFNNRQQEVIKSQAKLNELLLNKETAGVELDKQADLVYCLKNKFSVKSSMLAR